MSAYQEIPPYLMRSFRRAPAIIPEQFTKGFMPRGRGIPYDLTDMERWCTEQFGRREKEWFRKSIYFFVPDQAAFVFKMRWC